MTAAKTTLKHAIRIHVDEAMRQRAQHDGQLRQMSRTRASPWDAYIGTLGELVWAQVRYGTCDGFDTLNTRGQVDDQTAALQIEIKTSKTRVSPHSHLMVREDYALHRRPDFYVLVLIPQTQPMYEENDAFVCGWASHSEVIRHPPIERISNHTGHAQGFRCYEVAASDLHPLTELPFPLRGVEGMTDDG